MESFLPEFVEIMPNKAFVGTNKGGLYHAAERPRHAVEIKYKFAITKYCISFLWPEGRGKKCGAGVSSSWI